MDMRAVGSAYRVLVETPEGKRPLEKRKCRWEDNVKIDLREVRWYGLDSSDTV
jgi:hypothetical protein